MALSSTSIQWVVYTGGGGGFTNCTFGNVSRRFEQVLFKAGSIQHGYTENRTIGPWNLKANLALGEPL